MIFRESQNLSQLFTPKESLGLLWMNRICGTDTIYLLVCFANNQTTHKKRSQPTYHPLDLPTVLGLRNEIFMEKHAVE